MVKQNIIIMGWAISGWLGASLVIFGYYLNANEFTSSWLVWFAGNLLVGIYSLFKKAYSKKVFTLAFFKPLIIDDLSS